MVSVLDGKSVLTVSLHGRHVQVYEIVGLNSSLHGLKIHAIGIQGGVDSFDPQCGSLGSCA